MRKNINTENLEGRVYEHDLAIKQVQNKNSKNYGQSYIGGTLNVAVDEEGLNVIPVHYTYVSEFTKKGSKSSTFTNLKKIIDEGKVWLVDGKDAATKVKITTSLALNDFWGRDDNLISLKTNEGGFIDIVSSIIEDGDINRHKFTVDMYINGVKRIESEDPEVDPYILIKGAVFNNNGSILPLDFAVRNPDGMAYFESYDISPRTPLYTKVWGKINNVTTKIRKEDVSAFGETAVSFVEKTTKEWLVTGVSPEPYAFGDENVLTSEDIATAMQNREIMLAEKKKDRDEWQAKKTASNTNSFANGSAMNAPAANTPVGAFNF